MPEQPRASNPEHWLTNPSTHMYYGLYKGYVRQRTDPERLGRVRVQVVGLHGDDIPVEQLPWASPKSLAWNKGGWFSIPPVNELVWIEFEAGHVEYPVWSGGWWAKPIPPTTVFDPKQIEQLSNEQLAKAGFSPTEIGDIRSGKLKKLEKPRTDPQTSDGTMESVHPVSATKWFGGRKWTEGLLSMEGLNGLSPDDQPNNYGYSSPLQKHLEFDDRCGLQKVKISDQLDNMWWTNTEVGVSTWETRLGLTIKYGPKERNEDGTIPDPYVGTFRGWTLSTLHDAMQLYTYRGWQMTWDDGGKVMEICAPANADHKASKIRIDEKNQRVEIWTQDEHKLLLQDQQNSTPGRMTAKTRHGQNMVLQDPLFNDAGVATHLGSCHLMTKEGRHVSMDDENKRTSLSNINSRLLMEESGTLLDISGKLDILCNDGIDISAAGFIRMVGAQIHLNSDATAILPKLYTHPDDPTVPEHPVNYDRLPRAWEATPQEIAPQGGRLPDPSPPPLTIPQGDAN